MRAKIFFITLAVDDLDRSVAFYRDGLGWTTEGIVGQEFHDQVTGADGTIAIFTLDGGLLLTLYERTNLAKDASLPAGPPSSTEFSLGIPAASQAEVDRLLTQAEAAGGTVTAPAHMRPFGVYSGYFTDPDGRPRDTAPLHEKGGHEPVDPKRCPPDGEDKLDRLHETQVYQCVAARNEELPLRTLVGDDPAPRRRAGRSGR